MKGTTLRWVAVSDHLPSEDAAYIVHAPSADPESPFTTTAWFDLDGIGWCMLPECWCRAITHWMPLPEAPKEKEA